MRNELKIKKLQLYTKKLNYERKKILKKLQLYANKLKEINCTRKCENN